MVVEFTSLSNLKTFFAHLREDKKLISSLKKCFEQEDTVKLKTITSNHEKYSHYITVLEQIQQLLLNRDPSSRQKIIQLAESIEEPKLARSVLSIIRKYDYVGGDIIDTTLGEIYTELRNNLKKYVEYGFLNEIKAMVVSDIGYYLKTSKFVYKDIVYDFFEIFEHISLLYEITTGFDTIVKEEVKATSKKFSEEIRLKKIMIRELEDKLRSLESEIIRLKGIEKEFITGEKEKIKLRDEVEGVKEELKKVEKRNIQLTKTLKKRNLELEESKEETKRLENKVKKYATHEEQLKTRFEKMAQKNKIRYAGAFLLGVVLGFVFHLI